MIIKWVILRSKEHGLSSEDPPSSSSSLSFSALALLFVVALLTSYPQVVYTVFSDLKVSIRSGEHTGVIGGGFS